MFIKLQNISKSYTDSKILIKDLTAVFSNSDRIGIIGKNGEGKTTLLKLLLKEEEPDTGSIELSPNTSIGIHRQFIEINKIKNQRVEDFLFQDSGEIEGAYQALKSSASAVSKDCSDEELAGYLDSQGKFEQLGGYYIQAKVEEVVKNLFANEITIDSMVENLSGGQKTKLQLAKLLVFEPDILLLDEPTNHLDAHSIQWLEEFILHRKGITIIVSHDRAFLNKTVNKILEFEAGNILLYLGNYDAYFEQKQKKLEKAQEIGEDYKKHIKKLRQAVNVAKSKQKQFSGVVTAQDKKDYGKYVRGSNLIKAGKHARRAKMLNKRLESEKDEIESLKPAKYRPMKLKLDSLASTGDFVLRVMNYDLIVDNLTLIKNLELEVQRQKRVLIRGSNGSGKTTLFKRIFQTYETRELGGCYIKFGDSVTLGFYSQEHEGLDLDARVIDDFRREVVMSESDAAAYLHLMLFTHEQLYQKVSSLSQGEKSKLALAKLLVQKHNFLLLDEPTNHLDIPSKEVLEKALQEYQGTILLISHDQYFVERIQVDEVYEIKDDKLIRK